MLRAIFALALLLSSHAQAEFLTSGCNQADVDNAQEMLDLVKQSFGSGEVTLTQVRQAEIFLLEMKVCSGQVDGSVCNSLNTLYQDLVDCIKRETLVGSESTFNLLTVLHRQIEARIFCSHP